jgi:hypothetical protein
MINYGYFRHRFDAHLNPKLNNFVDDIGFVGYSYYYTLLEIYGAHYSKNKDSLAVKITAREIANTWRKRVDSVHLVLTKLQLSGLLVCTKLDATYLIEIPNFLKYYGSYQKTDRQDVANKRKENKRKENILETHQPRSTLTPDDIIQIWNDEMPKLGFEYAKGLSTNQQRKCIECFDFLKTKDEWREAMRSLKNKPNLNGNELDWKANITWITDPDKLSGLINGAYKTTLSGLEAWSEKNRTE